MSMSNGATPDDDVIQVLVTKRDGANDELQRLMDQAHTQAELVKRYERAIRVLTGETPKPSKPASKPATKTKLSQERVEAIKTAVLEYAQENDEFRQVDIRGVVDESLAKSTVMALAFEILRQDGVIRLARREGNNKWFRLTSEMLNVS